MLLVLPSCHLEDKPFGDLIETELQRILTEATLSEPVHPEDEPATTSSDSSWNGWERFIQPFEISYEYDNATLPADPSPEKEKTRIEDGVPHTKTSITSQGTYQKGR